MSDELGWAFVRRNELIRVLDHGYFLPRRSSVAKTLKDVSIQSPSHGADELRRVAGSSMSLLLISTWQARRRLVGWVRRKTHVGAGPPLPSRMPSKHPDSQLKKQSVFALSQLPREEGIPKLIDVARTQRNREVRNQAFFWLGQSQDPRVLAFIEEVLTK